MALLEPRHHKLHRRVSWACWDPLRPSSWPLQGGGGFNPQLNPQKAKVARFRCGDDPQRFQGILWRFEMEILGNTKDFGHMLAVFLHGDRFIF